MNSTRRRVVAGTAVLALLITFGLVRVLGGGDDPVSTTAAQGASSSTTPSPRATAPIGAGLPTPLVGVDTLTAPTADTADTADTAVALDRLRPVSLDIPSIGVHRESVVALGQNADGSSEVPTDFADVGWFEPGIWPGQEGAAMIGGHVDSKAGPAVFFELGTLKAGDLVMVGLENGTTAQFTVDRLAQYPKDDFPTQEVYGNPGRAELRLITCGGVFNSGSGHHLDNIVVYAHMSDVV